MSSASPISDRAASVDAAESVVSDVEESRPKSKLTEGEADLYLDQYNFTTTAAIVGSVDRKIFVLLRDGRMFFGVLRTFDQYANLILQHTVERIYIERENKYGECDRGVFMVRGENVVMLGEVDIDKEDAPLRSMERVPFEEAESYKQNADELKFKENTAKGKRLAQLGLSTDFNKGDLY
ncbi:unnamed protein product [Kluyveromyces dobzhanskii CBS 2104]|uniref:U6 snRNA-associated Sm-like protein LSm1 n=1 Tax=Kluyveromyces dobzhanskii CBS 2104 TaxID=1427455 RepID=A0A0A8L983_9SACH|nr:unnamed protein product [Kluyveromyces dobzhanskii CBS 2104]